MNAVLVCGSRLWSIIPPGLSESARSARAPIALAERNRTYHEIAAIEPTVVIHGAAAGGDAAAASCALEWALAEDRGIVINPYPAEWGRYRPKPSSWRVNPAGAIRNERMLREGKPDRGLAFGALWRRIQPTSAILADQWKHTGTGGMVSLMLRAGLPVRWVATHDAVAVDLVEMPEAGR